MLQTRFERRGHEEDLDQAIAHQRETLALFPVDHPDRSTSLNNLATQLSLRFQHQGNDKDLDQAITLHREALALRPVDHPDQSSSLSNLAAELSSRFEYRGNDEDLDQAIALHSQALALFPDGHPDWPKSLNNLAVELSSRFYHQGNDEDLDQGIALHMQALALRPDSNDEDLDQGIALHMQALALCPDGHVDWPKSLYDLANQLSSCFQHRGNIEDFDQSAENLCCAWTLLTQHDPRQLAVHESLAKVYLSFHHSGLDDTGTGEDTDSLNVAMHQLNAAANVVSAGLLPRLRASLRCVRHARQHSHDTELEAYATSMQLLDTYMSTTASVSSRHNIMKNFPSSLAVDAASYAGDHAAALMKKFRGLSSLLAKPAANYPEAIPRVDVEAEETKYRCLVKDWNEAVEDIREIEGFSRFLLPPLFSDLQDAARDGPIIVLIASESSCDAIIIPHRQPPTNIQLPTNFEKLQRLVLAVQKAIDKGAGPTGKQPVLTKALRELWNDVVCPVVEILGGLAQ
ncbi:hypothetical protein DFJ58DRAFT_730623 [Suillus subalutaceus]|uniref:uncharacterized protein n=1 Tax=Suillus subalutaceus TaxID=48586 RepID=UPI001B864306|nr:uncharacterized protein DFJ58DRAFT_730623 [Suillus subalutaceus]KAG1846241.1 hypothetical protein DFJ58DRAFT_730623 [Suillus subalutaceus]